MIDLSVSLGPVKLRSPLVAASGTVGSVVDFAGVAHFGAYGAMVAKSVATSPWPGNQHPRLAPVGRGMLNSIGIQNPGVDALVEAIAPYVNSLGVPIWGSAVGHSPSDFARVAKGLAEGGVAAVEVNLSCPNLEGHGLIALDPDASHDVMSAVRASVDVPVGAKLTPNAQNIAAVASAVHNAGADWVVLTNTVWGAAIDIETRRPRLHGYQGGYSGPPLKPIALRCVAQVAAEIPGLPLIGCGGVTTGEDVIEYLMAGASAVAIGSVHFAEPRAAKRILSELVAWCRSHDVAAISDLTGAVRQW